jgi:hypothetical protein
MDDLVRLGGRDNLFASPEEALDALRDHPEWDQPRRDLVFDELIARFPKAELLEAARSRLGELARRDGETVLRLVELSGDASLLSELARALEAQSELPLDRAWEAFSVLEGTGLIEESPYLQVRWEELIEAVENRIPIDELGVELEEPDGIWLTLQGLATVEPDVRSEIITGLAGKTPTTAVVEFLRLLTFAHDEQTRAAAIEVLEELPSSEPSVVQAWVSISICHRDSALAERARRRLSEVTPDHCAIDLSSRKPQIHRCLITSLNGQGRGNLVLVAEHKGDWVAADFLCDVRTGIADVNGLLADRRDDCEYLLSEIATRPEVDLLTDDEELSLGLLAGSLLLCGPGTTPALQYWLERTVGERFSPRPFPERLEEGDLAAFAEPALNAGVADLFASCPSWRDDSELTFDLAEEIHLRERGTEASPDRDAGAFRFLVEHRLVSQLELYRRMLWWMTAFWSASGANELARVARMVAWQLADPQHAVPSHPFLAALAARSLRAAQADLRQGIDPRHSGHQDPEC